MIIYTHQLTQQYHQNYHKIASMEQIATNTQRHIYLTNCLIISRHSELATWGSFSQHAGSICEKVICLS